MKPKKQVGGKHYEMKIQPLEYIEANELGYHEANVIKYISRWKNKNGVEDLNKAKWYIERLIEITTEIEAFEVHPMAEPQHSTVQSGAL